MWAKAARQFYAFTWFTWAFWGFLLLSLPAQALSEGDARHLLMRTGVGAAPADIEALKALNRPQAVEKILQGFTQRPTLRLSLSRERPETRQARRQQFRQQSWELKLWWHQQILQTHHPLRERMTLFWHNHFTSALAKVRRPELIYQQNTLLRQYALGDFRKLLHAIAKDPAMLLYLDGAQNNKAQPNENFARELLELFTLGEGHYSEKDIKEAARAFTGWSVNREGKFVLRKNQHDTQAKVFLGSGAQSGEDVINILLQQKRTGEWVVEKLWKSLISPHPDPQAVRYWGSRWRERGYDMEKLLRDILNSQAFWSETHRGALIKSPVDITLGSLRSLGVLPAERQMQYIARLNQRMGQDLFDPPNVKGWPGHKLWVDSRTLVMRQQFLSRLSRGMEEQNRMEMQSVVDWDQISLEQWQARLLPGPAVGELNDLSDILLDPVYQTK